MEQYSGRFYKNVVRMAAQSAEDILFCERLFILRKWRHRRLRVLQAHKANYAKGELWPSATLQLELGPGD